MRGSWEFGDAVEIGRKSNSEWGFRIATSRSCKPIRRKLARDSKRSC